MYITSNATYTGYVLKATVARDDVEIIMQATDELRDGPELIAYSADENCLNKKLYFDAPYLHGY